MDSVLLNKTKFNKIESFFLPLMLPSPIDDILHINKGEIDK